MKMTRLGQGQAYFKGGTLGFQGSGKTFTMALLAAGIREFFALKGPVAMFDTEGGSDYIGQVIKELTGEDLIGVKSRSIDDLAAFTADCQAEHISVAIAESMTHVWRNLCESHLAAVNEQRRQDRQPPRYRLEMSDWGRLKPIWNQRWADLYLNVPLHLIIAGRAGYEYEMQENEETKKRELITTGVKMKTEGEFGFEPSLLWEMEREQEPDGAGGFRMFRTITVLKDRFNVMDAKTFRVGSERDPRKALEHIMSFFLPHIQRLTPGVHAPVDTSLKAETGADRDGDTEWGRERRARVILSEEIAGVLVKYGLDGQGREDKARRLETLEEIFGTRSWTQIESLHSERLRSGIGALRDRFEPVEPAATDESPEAEIRTGLIGAVTMLEARGAFKEEFRNSMRVRHSGVRDLDAMSVDGLNAYHEALLAVEAAQAGTKTNKAKGSVTSIERGGK